MSEALIETIVSYAALGLIVGFGYYASVRWHAVLASVGAPAWAGNVVLVLRLAAAIIFFGWLASIGLTPIISAFAGFLIGRQIAFSLLEIR